jgi:hypothetical protein
MGRGEKKLFIWVLIFYGLIFRLYRRRLRTSQSMELETLEPSSSDESVPLKLRGSLKSCDLEFTLGL